MVNVVVCYLKFFKPSSVLEHLEAHRRLITAAMCTGWCQRLKRVKRHKEDKSNGARCRLTHTGHSLGYLWRGQTTQVGHDLSLGGLEGCGSCYRDKQTASEWNHAGHKRNADTLPPLGISICKPPGGRGVRASDSAKQSQENWCVLVRGVSYTTLDSLCSSAGTLGLASTRTFSTLLHSWCGRICVAKRAALLWMDSSVRILPIVGGSRQWRRTPVWVALGFGKPCSGRLVEQHGACVGRPRRYIIHNTF